jgi:hypothetical protein
MSHNTSCCLIEVVTKAGLTLIKPFLIYIWYFWLIQANIKKYRCAKWMCKKNLKIPKVLSEAVNRSRTTAKRTRTQICLLFIRENVHYVDIWRLSWNWWNVSLNRPHWWCNRKACSHASGPIKDLLVLWPAGSIMYYGWLTGSDKQDQRVDL